MNCQIFERDLPEWMSERLPLEKAQRMLVHSATCPRCQEALQAERALRKRWQELPSPPPMPELWSRLAQRIEVTPPQRRTRMAPVWAWTMSALATTSVLCTLFWMHSLPHRAESIRPPYSATTTTVDEQHIVQMVNDIQQLPENESEAFLNETQQERQTQRHILLTQEGP